VLAYFIPESESVSTKIRKGKTKTVPAGFNYRLSLNSYVYFSKRVLYKFRWWSIVDIDKNQKILVIDSV